MGLMWGCILRKSPSNLHRKKSECSPKDCFLWMGKVRRSVSEATGASDLELAWKRLKRLGYFGVRLLRVPSKFHEFFAQAKGITPTDGPKGSVTILLA